MTETLIVAGHHHRQQVEAEAEVHHQSFVIFEMDRCHVTKGLAEVEEDLEEALHHCATLLPFHLATTLLFHLAILLSHHAIALSRLEMLLFHPEVEEGLHLEAEADGMIDLTVGESRLLTLGNHSDLAVVVAHRLDLRVQITGRDLQREKESLCDTTNGDHRLHRSAERQIEVSSMGKSRIVSGMIDH